MTPFAPDAPDIVSHMPCDGRAVGVILTNNGRLLMFEPAAFPAGLAPIARHLDAQDSAVTAAVVETWKDVGLRLRAEDLTEVGSGWRPGLCRRIPARQDPDAVPAGGHHWTTYTAEAGGTLNPDEHEARRPRWMTPVEVAERALQTCRWAAGEVDDEGAFGLAAAMQPLWVRPVAQWFLANGLARLAAPLATCLDRIDALLAAPGPGAR